VSETGVKEILETVNRRFDLEVERIWVAFEGRTVVGEDQDMAAERFLKKLVRLARDPAAAEAGRKATTTAASLAPLSAALSLLDDWSHMPLLATLAREMWRRTALEDASRRHLDAVAAHLDLGPLWPALSPDAWAETDLLWQVSGPLLAAPLAWLPCGSAGERAAPLWQRVASTSTAITLVAAR